MDTRTTTRRLLPDLCKRAEYERQELIATPEGGTAVEDMAVPAYWAHVAKTLRPWDRIEVRPQDGSWWAELLVRTVEPLAVRVHVLRHVDFGAAALAQFKIADGYQVKHRGLEGYCVIRQADNAVLHAKEKSPEGAAAWLDGHLRRLGSQRAA